MAHERRLNLSQRHDGEVEPLPFQLLPDPLPRLGVRRNLDRVLFAQLHRHRLPGDDPVARLRLQGGDLRLAGRGGQQVAEGILHRHDIGQSPRHAQLRRPDLLAVLVQRHGLRRGQLEPAVRALIGNDLPLPLADDAADTDAVGGGLVQPREVPAAIDVDVGGRDAVVVAGSARAGVRAGDEDERCGRSPDRATGPTAGLLISGRPTVGRFGGVRDPRRAASNRCSRWAAGPGPRTSSARSCCR